RANIGPPSSTGRVDLGPPNSPHGPRRPATPENGPRRRGCSQAAARRPSSQVLVLRPLALQSARVESLRAQTLLLRHMSRDATLVTAPHGRNQEAAIPS